MYIHEQRCYYHYDYFQFRPKRQPMSLFRQTTNTASATSRQHSIQYTLQ